MRHPMQFRKRPFLIIMGGSLIVIFMIGVAFWNDLKTFQNSTSSSPPILFAVPNFTLTERSGKLVRLSDLHGKVWLANFIYTHCPDTCPTQSAKMAQFQKQFGDKLDFSLVSISIDPERDTPAVLAKYAEQFEADSRRWLFLTGEKEAIYDLAIKGFRLPTLDQSGVEHDHPTSNIPEASFLPKQSNQKSSAQEETSSSLPNSAIDFLAQWFLPTPAFAHQTGGSFMHSRRFVLVDRQGNIRGYYRSEETQEMEKLKQHIQILLK